MPGMNWKFFQRMNRYWWALDCTVLVLLSIVFGVLYLSNHAWGAWGDDSPGYIYTAGQFISNEALVVHDAITKQALDTFGEEPFARFVTPSHHDIISPTGWIASKYPIGLSWLMAVVATLGRSDELIYLVVPVLSVGVVLLTYLFPIVWLKDSPPTKRAIGIMAALSVGLASLFANYAVSQPMRDIPAVFFIVASLLMLGIVVRQSNNKPNNNWLSWILLFISGGLLGFAINIRETSAIMVLAVGVVLLWHWRTTKLSVLFKPVMIVLVGVVLAASLSIWNSYTISAHKEKFKKKDISSIAITSNFDHIQSLSIHNIYNNQGKFRPGVGGAQQYWDVMSQFSLWPPFLLSAIIGLVLLWFTQRKLASVLTIWVGTTFLLFSMWINPYPRYILALLPAVALCSAYGVVVGVRLFQRVFSLHRFSWSALTILIALSYFVALEPSYAERKQYLTSDELIFKSISRDDLHIIKSVTTQLEEDRGKPPMLLMLGSWKAGISETIMAHSNVRVIRFPSKPAEQPDREELINFLHILQDTYTLYLWYDSTATADEQYLYNNLAKSVLRVDQYTFQPNVEISIIQ